MLKRLGIFCFYDKEGIVDEYILYLLEDLKKNLDTLIIVINGKLNSIGKLKFETYTKWIIARDNKGFDAGAYRNVIVDVLGEDEIKKWDEIVFCNDTFFGPFFSFEKIFLEMDRKNVDFWGLDYRECKFLSFIQSYFLVFKKRVVANGDLFNYLKENIDSDCREISDVYTFFELGLFSYLTKQGYNYGSFVYTENYDVYLNGDRCIEEFQLPILKRKCFSPQYYSKDVMLRALCYIQSRFDYDISLILKNIYRLYGIDLGSDVVFYYDYLTKKSVENRTPTLAVSETMIVKFIQQNPDIYIYGSGIIARKIWHLFHKSMICFKGFIISDGEYLEKTSLYDYPIIYYKNISPGIAAILGVNFENCKKIIPTLKAEDNVLNLWEGLENHYKIS